MNSRKFASIGLTVLIATFLWTVPVWAEQTEDTGYPWFADIEDNQTIPQRNTVFREAPVLPSEEDTGYPWFADIKEDNKAIMKPVTVFGVHRRTAEEDTGYPWSADTNDDQTVSQPSTTTQ